MSEVPGDGAGQRRREFFRTVRDALRAGDRAGGTHGLQPRGGIGASEAGPEPALWFAERVKAVGGIPHMVDSGEAAWAVVREIIQGCGARTVLLERAPAVERLRLAERLPSIGVGVIGTARDDPSASREDYFRADLGITGVDYAIAETGSLVLAAAPDRPRSTSLLPPVHIAVVEAGQVLGDLFDLFISARWNGVPELPSCVTVVTGPSKTGDIELRLVTGVHGPGEVHVIIVREPAAAAGEQPAP